jgi:hypothetical protein
MYAATRCDRVSVRDLCLRPRALCGTHNRLRPCVFHGSFIRGHVSFTNHVVATACFRGHAICDHAPCAGPLGCDRVGYGMHMGWVWGGVWGGIWVRRILFCHRCTMITSFVRWSSHPPSTPVGHRQWLAKSISPDKVMVYNI